MNRQFDDAIAAPAALTSISTGQPEVLPETTVFTHLEPREEPVSFIDQALDRDPATEDLSRPAPAEEKQA